MVIMWKQCIPACFSPCCFSFCAVFFTMLFFILTVLQTVLGRVSGDGLKDELFTRSDNFSGPKGRQWSIGAWKGLVVSDGCNSFHNTPRCKSQAEGHLGPNQQYTDYLLGQPSPSCLVTLLLCSPPTYSHVQTHTERHTHTYTHVHTFPELLPTPVSLLTHSPWLHLTYLEPATHYPQNTGDFGMPFTLRLEQQQ